MPFTKEDLERITKSITDKTHAQDVDIKALTDLGFVLRTKDEQTAYESNLRTKIVDEVRGEEDLPAYKNIESALEQLTGVKKNDGERATDFLKRIVAPMKEQQESLQKEIEALKEGKTDDPRLAALQQELKDREKEYNKQVKEANQQLVNYRLDTEKAALRKAAEAIPMNVPDEVKLDVIEARINKFYAEHEVRFNEKGEREVFNKKTGIVLTNPSTLELIDPAAVLPNYFSDIKADAGGTGGTGTTKTDGGTGGTGGKTKSDYSQAKTQTELHEMMSKDGMTSDSKEFIETYESVQKGYQEATGKPMPLRQL